MMQRYAAVAGLPAAADLPVPVLTPWPVEPLGRAGDPGAAARSRGRWSSRCARGRLHASTTSPTYVPDPPERSGRLRPRGRARPAHGSSEADVATRWSSARRTRRAERPAAHRPDWAGGSLYVDERTRVGRRVPGGAVARSSRASAVSTAGTRSRWPGAVRGCSTGPSAASACGAGGATRAAVRRRALDFWRVEEREPGRLLRLRAEMRLPGPGLARARGGHGRATGDDATRSGRSSTRAACSATPTGGRSRRSTASSSAHGAQHRPRRRGTASRPGTTSRRRRSGLG